jgi:transposase
MSVSSTAMESFVTRSSPTLKLAVNNSHSGIAKQQVERVYACLEATGTYGERLAFFLHEDGHTVSVINPAAVKAYAGAQLSRTKTDKVDAELIARFCHTQQPVAWTPPAPEIHELQALVRRLETLTEMRTAESNRLEATLGADEVLRRSLEDHMAYLDAEIKRTEKLIRTHINNHLGLNLPRKVDR